MIDPDNMQTGGIFAVFHQLGPAAGLMTMYAMAQTAGNYKAGHPEDWEIPESEFMAVCNTECADTVRKAKRQLESKGIFPTCEGSGKRRRFAVDLKAIDKLAADGPPPARKAPKGDKATCRPRTQPEVVMVRVPGSLDELPINDACEKAGGRGARCVCPLHAISETSFVDDEEVKLDQPRTHSGLDASPPPAEPALTAQELRAAIEPLCLEIWGQVPDDGPILSQATAALQTRDAIPALRLRMEGCRGRRNKQMGLLPLLAKAARGDYRATQQANANKPAPYAGVLVDGKVPDLDDVPMQTAEEMRAEAIERSRKKLRRGES